MPSISKRLSTIADFVEKDANVFDVGADHGLIEKYLIERSITNKITAVENKIGPYNTLKNSLSEYSDVNVVLSDGVTSLNSYDTTLIIAGMGGKNIINILSKDLNKLNLIKNIIVDAHRDNYQIKKFLTINGFKIKDEKIVFEDSIYYFVVLFEKGINTYNDLTLKYSLYIKNDHLYEGYLNKTITQLENKIDFLKASNEDNSLEIEKLNNEIKELKLYENN